MKAQDGLIEKIQECIQLLVKSKKEEQTRLDLSQLRNELHETKNGSTISEGNSKSSQT